MSLVIPIAPQSAAAPQSPLSAQVEIGGEEVIARHASRWEALWEETEASPFLRPEWAAAYLRAFEHGSDLILITVNAGERLVAVLPMVRKRGWYAGLPLMKLSGAANAHSVQFDILRSPCESGAAAVDEIWRTLRRFSGWQILEFPVFPAGSVCQQIIGSAQSEGYRTVTFPYQNSPVLRMQRDPKGELTWLAQTSRHFRHELRRWARLVEEESGAKLSLVRTTKPDQNLLERFYRLEAAGWKGQERSAIMCSRETRDFYNRIAGESAQRGYFYLHSLECNGNMLAAAFSVATARCFYPLKIAYDETFRRAAPGQLLFNGIFQECAASRIPELFFGGGVDRYKKSWTSETVPHFNGFVFNRGVSASLAHLVRTKIMTPLGGLRRAIEARLAERTTAKNTKMKVRDQEP